MQLPTRYSLSSVTKDDLHLSHVAMFSHNRCICQLHHTGDFEDEQHDDDLYGLRKKPYAQSAENAARKNVARAKREVSRLWKGIFRGFCAAPQQVQVGPLCILP